MLNYGLKMMTVEYEGNFVLFQVGHTVARRGQLSPTGPVRRAITVSTVRTRPHRSLVVVIRGLVTSARSVITAPRALPHPYHVLQGHLHSSSVSAAWI